MNCIQREALGNWLLTCGQAIKQWEAADQDQNTVEILEQWHANQSQALAAFEQHVARCEVCRADKEEHDTDTTLD